jgi:hypothetical protein
LHVQKSLVLVRKPNKLPLASHQEAYGLEYGSDVLEIQEVGQQLGDIMASIDEAGGSAGTLGQNDRQAATRLFARLDPDFRSGQTALSHFFSWIPEAHAVLCSDSSTFGACTGSTTVTRSFGGCTLGSLTFTGSTSLIWSNAGGCSLAAFGDFITRQPSITVTGRRGATLTINRSGTFGQKLTWQSGLTTNKVFGFSNDGIRRIFATGSGVILADLTTTTTADITVTGTTRTNRVLSGGNLRVTNNVSGVTCDYVPASVAWTAGCNCPNSGNWSGTCSDGKATSLTLNGCGTGTLTIGAESTTFAFDRCGS